MGFDTQRFPNGFDEELICTYSIVDFDVYIIKRICWIFSGAICGGILQDPVQAPTCEHAFCQVNQSEFNLTKKIIFLAFIKDLY